MRDVYVNLPVVGRNASFVLDCSAGGFVERSQGGVEEVGAHWAVASPAAAKGLITESFDTEPAVTVCV